MVGWVCPFTSDAIFSKTSHRLCPRHLSGGLTGGAGAVGSGLVPAEQRPQAGPATPLDDTGTDLAPRRYALPRCGPRPHSLLRARGRRVPRVPRVPRPLASLAHSLHQEK